MTVSMSECEELGAPQVARDEASARDKAIRRVVLQPVQTSHPSRLGDGGAKLGHWSGGGVPLRRRRKTLPVVGLGLVEVGKVGPGDLFCGGL